MVRKILKYLACVVAPATLIAAVAAVFITQSLFGRFVHGTFFLSKLPTIFAAVLAGCVVTSVIVLALALLIRRTGWPVAGCFAAAWIVVTLAQATFTAITTTSPVLGHFLVLSVLPARAAGVGILTIAVASAHRWLFGRKPTSRPETAF